MSLDNNDEMVYSAVEAVLVYRPRKKDSGLRK